MGRYGGKYYQGYYKLINPAKYDGNPDEVIYRSGLEYKYFRYLDLNKNVLKWGSETIQVPYRSLDGKIHRYFVDIYVKVKQTDGKIVEYLCEIKPYEFQFPPKDQKRKTQRWKDQYQTYLINQAKWEAAKEFCKKCGWAFQILTERDIR